MLKVAIIGCGKIADRHAEQIRLVADCEIVGVCDNEELMAKQLQERLGVPAYFTDVRDLLDKAKPDVAHITTPPQSHYPLGKICLEAGCNVYIEKPFTVELSQAEELIAIAEHRNLKATVGHDAQFSDAALRMRQIVGTGYLGGPPIHIESYHCYSLSDPGYAKSLLGDSNHWIRKLPGGLMQNNISHGICKIAEFLPGDSPELLAYGFTSPLLKSIGETQIMDELRVIIHDGPVTAYYTFSTQMKPSLHQLRLYGPKNGLILDDDQQTVIKVRGTAYKSYLEQFAPQWGYAKQYIGNSWGNMTKFLKRDFHGGARMRVLFEKFYDSISKGAALPIPYAEILRTSRIMDDIFTQLNAAKNAMRAGQSEEVLVEAKK
ncbi:MAG: Gfo/Idh/MocA family oxidoreductase [Candidatus Acidiferrales bacterium]